MPLINARVTFNKADAESKIKEVLDAETLAIEKAAGDLIKEDFRRTAEAAITNFYRSFTPNDYERTYGMMDYYKVHNQKRGKHYQAWIEIDPSFVGQTYPSWRPNKYPGDMKDIVFNLVIFNGKHGMAENFGVPPGPLTTPSPYLMLLDKQEEIAEDAALYYERAMAMVGL